MRRTLSTVSLAALALTGALALGACGSSSSASTPAPSASRSGSGQGGGGQRAGAAGLIAAVTGSTAQVQSTSSQTAVTWNDKTTFSKTVPATAAALKVGQCVSARAATSGSGNAANGGASAPTSIDAATVALSDPVGGSCAGPGGGQGGPSGGAGTPSPRPSRSGGFDGRGFGGGAFGTVASVGSGSFTVTQAARGNQPASTITVTYAASTTFTTQATAAATDVKVGGCLQASGPHDSTGAVTATSIRLSDPVNGTCQTGFGRRPGNGPGAGASPSV